MTDINQETLMLDIPPAPHQERATLPLLFLARQRPADQVRHIADWLAENTADDGGFGRLALTHRKDIRTCAMMLRSAVDGVEPRKPWWRIFR